MDSLACSTGGEIFLHFDCNKFIFFSQALNFYLVPSQLRVFYVSSVLLVWTVILSYIKHKVCLPSTEPVLLLITVYILQEVHKTHN